MSSMREVLAIAVPKGRGFKVGLLLSMLQGLSAVALLACSAWLISRASQQPNVVYVSLAVVGVRAFAVGRAAFRYGERMVLHNAAFGMLTASRPRLLERLIPLAPAGLGGLDRAQALQRLVGDVDELQNLSLRVIAPLLQSLLVSVVAAGFLASFAPLAGIALALAALAALLIAAPLAAGRAKRADLQLAGARELVAQRSLGILENAALLEAYGWLDHRFADFAAAEADLLRVQRRGAAATGITSAAFAILAILATVATAWFGAAEVAAGRQPGVMLAVFALLPMAVFDVLAGAQGVAQSWNRVRSSAERVLELLNREVPSEIPYEIRDAIDPASTTKVDLGKIEELKLTDVSARYPGAGHVALVGCNLTIHPGERLLITGESGAGKSTIANVLLRFLESASGSYEINGRPAGSYSIESIRTRIGLIEQRPTVFWGTVRQNLLLAGPNATDVELVDALERVGLWATLEPRGGLELFLGEQAQVLSGGEAARLALARALIAKFEVIIFDEPTANLDPATAAATMAELVGAASDANRAVIVISHDSTMARLTTSAIVVETPRRA